MCLTKIEEIKVALINFFDTRGDKNTVFDTCRSRILHISGRVYRLGNLPHYKTISNQLQNICEDIIQLIEKLLCNICDIDKGRSILVEIMSHLPENRLDFDYRDKQSVNSPSNPERIDVINEDENVSVFELTNPTEEPSVNSVTVRSIHDTSNRTLSGVDYVPSTSDTRLNQTQYVSFSYSTSELNTGGTKPKINIENQTKNTKLVANPAEIKRNM